MSYEEIAKLMGVSHWRIRQIERTALKKAREVARRKGLRADDLIDCLRRAN